MKDKTSKNLKMNLFITVAIGVLNFVSNKYFAKYMGMETLGLMKLFTQMIAYLNLAELGIGTASTYALYKPLLEKNKKQINIVVSTIDSFYKKTAFSIIILGMISSFFLPFFIENTKYGNYIYLYWILYVLNISLGYVFAKYSILFTANQEYGFVRKVQGLGKIIFQILQILFLIKIQSFVLFIIIMMGENIYNYYFYYKHYKQHYNYIEKVKERDKNIVKDMKNLFWHKIGALVVHNTDYIILSKFISLSIVGVYSSYLIIYQMVMTIINILTPVLTPKIGLFVAKNSKEKIYIYWRELYGLYVFLTTIFITCTYNLILPFVNLWLGQEFLVSKLTVVLILINLYIHLTRGVTEVFKNSCGFFDDTYAPAIESILNLVFSLGLVQKLGLNGVIIGTVISNLIVIALLKPILVFRKCFNKRGMDYLLASGKLFFLSGVSITIIQILVNKFLGTNLLNIYNWFSFIYNASIMGVISIAIVSGIFILDSNFRMFTQKIVKELKI